MATRKKASQTSKASSKSKKTSARTLSGAVPPYGDPIHKAIARGDVREMKTLAASTRKWLADVNAALAKLESSIKKTEG